MTFEKPFPFNPQRQLNLIDMLFDRIPLTIVVLDQQFRLQRFNPTWAEFSVRYSSLSSADIKPGVRYFDIFQDSEAALAPLFKRALAGETIYRDDVRIERDEDISYWDFVLAPLQENGAAAGILIIGLDDSERMNATIKLGQTLQALREREERLDLVLRGTNEGIWDWNTKTGEVYYSPRWKAMLGYQDEEVKHVFDSWRELIHPDDADRALAVVQSHLAGETDSFELEHRLRHQDGSYRWILARGILLKDSEGKPYRMAGSHTDITSRKLMEEALKTSEANLRSLLENASNFVVYQLTVDESSPYGGRVSIVSPSIKHILGISDPDRFESWFENVHPGDRNRVLRANQKAIHSGEPYDQTVRFFHPEKNDWVWMHTVSNPVYDSDGILTHFNGLIVDVTEQKQAEEALQSQLAFENIITSISTNFINLDPDEVDLGIQRALQVIGEFTGIDRSYVTLFSADGELITTTHEWCASGIPSQSHRMQSLPAGRLPWFESMIKALKVVHIPTLSALPEQAAAEQAECLARNIRSFIMVPLAFRGDAVGYVAFESITSENVWQPASIRLLTILAEILVNALEHKRSQAIQAGQRQFLELLAAGGSLSETLHALVQIIEEQWPGMQGLVLLLDEDGKHLHVGAAESLPQAYALSIEGLEIGPQVGSCGTAAYYGKRVIVEDIQSDPRWEGLRDLAAQHQLGACWSEPVVSSTGEILGTFAMYYRSPRSPSEGELRTIETGAHLAGIAIEHKRSQDELKQAYQSLEMRVEERTRQISTLLDLSYSLASTIELEPQLDLILDQLRYVVEYSGASIFYLEKDMLGVVAYRGPIPQEDALQVRLPLNIAGANKAVIETRQPAIIPDILGETALARAFRETAGEELFSQFGYIRSWMGVPLIVRDQVIGMLTLDHPQPNYYAPAHHSKLALAFANQVAAAIENARLYNEVRQRADEAQTLFAVQQAITSRLDPDTVLQMIADEARRLTNTEQSAVYLLKDQEFEVAVVSGDVKPEIRGLRLPVEGSVAGLAIQTGQPYHISSSETDPRVYSEIIDRTGAHSFIIVPIMSSERAVGTITVANKQGRDLGPEDERVLTMLAAGAVVALENARLYHDEQERRREIDRRRLVAEGLRDILAVLNSNTPLPEVLDYIAHQACQLLGASSAVIRHADYVQRIVRTAASWNLPHEFDFLQETAYADSYTIRELRPQHPVVIPDLRTALAPLLENRDSLSEATRTAVDAELKYYHSLLAVPLALEGEMYGGLLFYFASARDFSEEDIYLATALSDQAALAIENARLRSQIAQNAVLTERNRLARDLHDAVTQTLFSASLIAEVLPRLWERKPEEGIRRLNELRQLTRGALAEMRTLLLELRPQALVEAEVNELFRHLTDAYSSRARVPVEYSIEGHADLPEEVKIALYRIAQEALNNISKHADAKWAGLRVRCEPDQVTLHIQDDGRGFDMASIPPEHLGLGIMKERAEQIGAKLNITSAPGEGTLITVTWSNKKRSRNGSLGIPLESE